MHLRVGWRLPQEDTSLPRHPVLGRIGRTPLVELAKIPGPDGPRVFAKVESANPGGSVKDRAARAIVTAAFRAGELPRQAPARLDEREHRDRVRDARGGPRVRRHALRAGLGQPGAAAHPPGVRLRGDRDGPARGVGRGDRPRPRPARRAARRLLLRRPVLEPRQPGRARGDDRARDPGAAARAAPRPVRGRPRHERHVRRRRPASSGARARARASCRSSPTRRSTASRVSSTWRRALVPAIYDPTLADARRRRCGRRRRTR